MYIYMFIYVYIYKTYICIFIYIYVTMHKNTYIYARLAASFCTTESGGRYGWCAPASQYRGTSLIRNTLPVGHYSIPVPRDLW